jgi:hypothetical protein
MCVLSVTGFIRREGLDGPESSGDVTVTIVA